MRFTRTKIFQGSIIKLRKIFNYPINVSQKITTPKLGALTLIFFFFLKKKNVDESDTYTETIKKSFFFYRKDESTRCCSDLRTNDSVLKKLFFISYNKTDIKNNVD